MSLLCALAPSITLLAVTRTLQGLAGAAVAVVAMAVVRDLFSGIRAAQLLSRLILVLGVAPILAPSLGSCAADRHLVARHLRRPGPGRRRLLVLALRGAAGDPAGRAPPGRSAYAVRCGRTARLFSDRLFVMMVLVAGLMFATLFAYIAGAPFILQGLYGLTPQQFGLAFSANAVGMIAMTQLNPCAGQALRPGQRAVRRRADRAGRRVVLLVPMVLGRRRLARLHGPARSSSSRRPGCPSRTPRRSRSTGTARRPARPRRCSAPRSSSSAARSPRWSARSTTAPPVPMAAIIVGTTGLAAVLLLSARN